MVKNLLRQHFDTTGSTRTTNHYPHRSHHNSFPVGPSIGSNAFWASYHGEGNESLTPDRLPLIGSTADLTSLKSSAADDDDGFESEHEVL